MKKKFLCFLLLALISLTACNTNNSSNLSGNVSGDTEISEEYTPKKDPVAKNFSWIVNNGTLAIKGYGAMPDFKSDKDVPWAAERENISKVVISKGISHIGDHAFYNCRKLTQVSIPNSVTSIGDDAFRFCKELTFVSIPSKVTHIGKYCFGDCTHLTSIAIYEKVDYIGNGAFYQCDSLAEISVESSNKNYLSENGVLFNKDKTTLIRYAPNKNEQSYIIPNSVTLIAKGAFDSCHNLESITIPDSVSTLEDYAFYGCYNLVNISIPDSVTSIGHEAFWGCYDLTSISIPGSVKTFGGRSFENCDSLTEINVDSSNPKCSSKDGVLYSKDGKTLICYPNGKPEKDYSIPQGVTSINGWAFAWHKKIITVNIPDGVTSIGSYAFWFCERLTSVSIPNSVTSIGYNAFDDCKSMNKIIFNGTKAEWEAIEKNNISSTPLTIVCTDGVIK